ncbi:MAG: hypothetical protein ACI8T1_005434 [Verrucomicrobiales bacterium]|jgi:hypothetical protein
MPEFLAFLTLSATMLVALAWLVIGWRAMRALEKLAEAVTQFTNRQESENEVNLRLEAASQTRLYKQFLSEDANRTMLPAKNRHEAFRIWLESKGV